MIRTIKKLNRNTKLGNNILFQYCLNCYYYLRHFIFSDKVMIESKFKKFFGYALDLNNPKTFNEKIQWLKLNDRSALHTLCADKFKVRQYITEKIGDAYLVPLIFETKNPKQINSKNISNFPVIVKMNHDSANIFIFKDSSSVNWKKTQSDLSRELKKNYYYASQEWQYKNIERRIIVEKLLVTSNNKPPIDCKVLCFNGKAKYITMDFDKGLPTHNKIFFDKDWKVLPIYMPSKGDKQDEIKVDPINLIKPKDMDNIILLSEILSENFIHVRIDWHYINDRFYNGEITFHSGNGLNLFNPKKWDRILGDQMDLPLPE